MNSTQRGAWIGLIGMMFGFALSLIGFTSFFVLKKAPPRFMPHVAIGGLIIWIVLFVLLLRKKQSPVEVETDERDKLITTRAILASFVSVWVCLAAVSLIPRWIIGIKGLIPFWVVPIVNLGIMLVAALVFTVAILIQYGWTSKRGKS